MSGNLPSDVAGDVEMHLETSPSTSIDVMQDVTAISSSVSSPVDTLHPIAILMDELKHAELSVRLNAISNLSTIALALGPDRTRSELMPFLKESVMEDEDELLLTLAGELGNFVEYVGGSAEAHHLLIPLEPLCDVEEPIVRAKAIESIQKLTKEMDENQVKTILLPLLYRLASAPWFTSRMSAAVLFPIVFSRQIDDSELLNSFLLLVHDDTPMVRRAAATSFPDILSHLTLETLQKSVFPAFQQITRDDQDSVRLLSVGVLVGLAEALGKLASSDAFLASLQTELLPALEALFEDHSWRVHYVLAEKFPLLITHLYKPDPKNPLVSPPETPEAPSPVLASFVKLLQDEESEVRTMACKVIPEICGAFDQSAVQRHILPVLQDLTTDRSDFVRAALALQISELSPFVGKEATEASLLPILVTLLRDTHSEVRLNIISKLEKINHVLGIDLLSQSLLPTVVELSKDTQWRVRMAIVEHMPLLASQLGPQFFESSLKALCLAFFADPVFTVRMAVLSSLSKIMTEFGKDWAKTAIFPQIMAKASELHYLYRLMALHAIRHFTPLLLDAMVSKSIFLPVAVQLTKDPVPNVRFNAAKSLAVLAAQLHSAADASLRGPVADVILPCLQALQTDADEDVVYFAKKAAVEVEAL